MPVKLLSQAYHQYHCYKDGTPFTLRGDYVFVSAITIRDGRPFGFVVQDESNNYLVFRGTSGWRDWLTGEEVKQTYHAFGKVHEGGYEFYQQLRPSLHTADINPYLKFVILGHSLGSWPATFAAVDLAHLNPTVCVYGSPRVGDKLFADNVNKMVPRYTRYLNSEDIAPTLPLPGDYCHIGVAKSFTVSADDTHGITLYEQYCA
jgi:hypothetical protein